MGIKQQLKNTQSVAFEDLESEIGLGAKFVVFSYTISLLAITLKRLTSVYYLPPGEQTAKYKNTADKLSLVFGWWCLPWGPMRTFQSLSINRKGGIDVTKDVMVNLTKEQFEQMHVILEKVYSPYAIPNKSETKYLRKSLHLFLQQHPDINEYYFALYVNTSNPYFVIGLPTEYTVPERIAELKEILYKSFRRNAYFQFIDLDDDSDMSSKLKELALQ